MEHEFGAGDPDVVADAQARSPVPETHPSGPGVGVGVGAPGQDRDGADVAAGPATADLDIDGSLLDTIEQELADVERALALLDEGTYGQCEVCGRAVGDDVLARVPTARFCADHLPLTLR